jgi:hexosaminidase
MCSGLFIARNFYLFQPIHIMNVFFNRLWLLNSLSVILMLSWGAQLQATVIPMPQSMVFSNDEFVFRTSTRWIVPDASLVELVTPLVVEFEQLSGLSFKVQQGRRMRTNTVVLSYDDSLTLEAYSLHIDRKNIVLKAACVKGFFYGLQSLRQLAVLPGGEPNQLLKMPGNTRSNSLVRFGMPKPSLVVPGVTIADEPRFGYRGFMLDVSRYFMPKEWVLRLIEHLAMHKINVLHLHLVDDNGWRIEIKKYPLLTDIGAWRVDRLNPFPLRANPEAGEATVVGGYYTQDDIREIVAHAARHQMEVIPEIEMPAHTNSSLAAYPHLACPVVPSIPGVLPGGGGDLAAVIYCAGNDSVFSFLEDVLTEVMELFPSRYIHIGGDEAVKTHWKECPLCQERMRQHNIPNEEELQSYFISRINGFLHQHGKQLMGWDELVDSNIPDSAVIFGWRGAGKGAEIAGAQGFQYIKTPAWYYYFIRYQGPQWFEPYTYFGNTTLRDVYLYEPLPDELDEHIARNMLGIQACLWTEFVSRPEDAWYLVFPRLAAFAESAWSLPERKNWDDFNVRLQPLLRHYDRLGIVYARSMYNIQHTVKPSDGLLSVKLENIVPELEIRYTIDGSEPAAGSPVYSSDLQVKPGSRLRAATFGSTADAPRMGEILTLNTLSNKATGLAVVSDESAAYLLTNGVMGSEKITDGEWIDLYARDAVFELHFTEQQEISRVGLGMLNNAGMGVHFPSNIELFLSVDGEYFESVYDYSFSDYERFQQGIFRTTRYFEFAPYSALVLRVKIKQPGVTPPFHVRPGILTRSALDELIVE